MFSFGQRITLQTTVLVSMLLALSACTSERAFENKESFSDYVAPLKLTGKKVDAAMQILANEGFRCYPQENRVMCLREESNGICKQKQVLILPPNLNPETLVESQPEASLLCL